MVGYLIRANGRNGRLIENTTMTKAKSATTCLNLDDSRHHARHSITRK